MRRLFVLSSLLLALSMACGGGLSDADRTDLVNATRLDGLAYRYEDASSPSAALVRGAYCANAAVMRNQQIAYMDAGIACAP